MKVFPSFSQELRELEAQLKAAYMNKERSAQLAEKEALKIDEMVRPLCGYLIYQVSYFTRNTSF